MKLATITPVYDLDLCKETSNLYLVLSWLCQQNPEYKSYWINLDSDAYKILDNGANEGKLSDDLDILNLAMDIDADEIYDFIFSYCVIEHIDNPNDFLEKQFDILDNDELVSIALPI